MAWSNCRCHRL
ncbi:hypothetical protein B4U80_06746 [Leptotrombidium deliense]|uniref:Uncharacterized protein n=1 Tax=Leptotrombidium deliense TaxID=299467 RepID=A0A443SGQ1_9ACAR|nr:hypothetical protein B4U80_06746 [Leptotrombidium deliense]